MSEYPYPADATIHGMRIVVDERVRPNEIWSPEAIQALNRAEKRDEQGWPVRDAAAPEEDE